MSSQDISKLIADLEAEFGKKKKEKKSEREKGKEELQKLNKASFTNNFETRSPNEFSNDPEFSDQWQPQAREIWIFQQHCICCFRETEYIGGEYVRFRNARSHATIQRRQDFTSDPFRFNKDIPEEHIFVSQDVERCPKCLKEEKQVDELLLAAFRVLRNEQEKELQLDLPGLELK